MIRPPKVHGSRYTDPVLGTLFNHQLKTHLALKLSHMQSRYEFKCGTERVCVDRPHNDHKQVSNQLASSSLPREPRIFS